MQDAEAKEWFKNTFNCDYYDILLLDVTIRMTIVGHTLKGNNAIDIKNAVKIINYLLKKYDNIYKQNYMTYEEFYEIIEKAFTDSIQCLKENRFAVIVCGDVRNRSNGAYYGFPNDIIDTFERNGMILYNNIKLLFESDLRVLSQIDD